MRDNGWGKKSLPCNVSQQPLLANLCDRWCCKLYLMSKSVAFFYHGALICVPTLERVVYLIMPSKLADLPYEEVVYIIQRCN